MQVNLIKYRQGVKIASSMKDCQIPTVNMSLRGAGFDDAEINAFWQSSPELRLRKLGYDIYLEKLSQMDEIEETFFEK